jgi:hypothetical protein
MDRWSSQCLAITPGSAPAIVADQINGREEQAVPDTA